MVVVRRGCVCRPGPVLRAREKSKSKGPSGEETDDRKLYLHVTQAVTGKGEHRKTGSPPSWTVKVERTLGKTVRGAAR